MDTIRKMLVEEMADGCALDFFTRAPKYRTREQLQTDIAATIDAAIGNYLQRYWNEHTASTKLSASQPK